MKLLPKNECRFAVFNFEYVKDFKPKSKFIWIYWIPTLANREQKKFFEARKEEFRKKFIDIHLYIDAEHTSHLKHFRILQKVLYITIYSCIHTIDILTMHT